MIENVKIIVSDDFESVQFGNINTIKIVNPNLSLKVPVIPTALTFSITVLVIGRNLSNITSAQIEVFDNEGNQVFSTGQNSTNVAQNITDFNLNVSLRNVLINTSGTHKVVVTLGEDSFEDCFLIEKI